MNGPTDGIASAVIQARHHANKFKDDSAHVTDAQKSAPIPRLPERDTHTLRWYSKLVPWVDPTQQGKQLRQAKVGLGTVPALFHSRNSLFQLPAPRTMGGNAPFFAATPTLGLTCGEA